MFLVHPVDFFFFRAFIVQLVQQLLGQGMSRNDVYHNVVAELQEQFTFITLWFLISIY